ncbi:hypothetical protein [Sphingobacterium corticibacterium]|uniref:Uncharacterized protein n=1 Tax=Sphingobacterium corticibacterium TaxID=2484746 RepID=A0A4Q6XYZ4_9SPHI|nr:hypothetical protein [Sphingobacterium corticibacterium]RZF62189.1 hypothetical protein EWE74_05115 [Sphingobacterium corticibacterium]
MNKQFPFTSTGVQEWQTDLYQQGATAIQNERTLIEADLVAWLSVRFILHADQQSFAQNLGAPTHQIYAIAISNALDEQTPIVLEKEESSAKKGNPYEHPKLSQMRYQIKTSAEVGTVKSISDPVQQRELIFSLHYLDNKL